MGLEESTEDLSSQSGIKEKKVNRFSFVKDKIKSLILKNDDPWKRIEEWYKRLKEQEKAMWGNGTSGYGKYVGKKYAWGKWVKGKNK